MTEAEGIPCSTACEIGRHELCDGFCVDDDERERPCICPCHSTAKEVE